METIKAVWSITFFFFMLILIYVWSKISVISNKIRRVIALVDRFDIMESDTQMVDSSSEENK